MPDYAMLRYAALLRCEYLCKAIGTTFLCIIAIVFVVVALITIIDDT